jgi:hypothetical protein
MLGRTQPPDRTWPDARLFHARVCRKGATTFPRNDWLSGAKSVSVAVCLRALGAPGFLPLHCRAAVDREQRFHSLYRVLGSLLQCLRPA